MMVYCEGGCEDWYHCSCVDIDEEDAKELLDRFICPKCTVPEEAFTTFKPMCRLNNLGVFLKRHTCRKAAMAANHPASKFCSIEHRNQWAKFLIRSLPPGTGVADITRGGTITDEQFVAIAKDLQTVAEFINLGRNPLMTRKSDEEKEYDDAGKLFSHTVPRST